MKKKFALLVFFFVIALALGFSVATIQNTVKSLPTVVEQRDTKNIFPGDKLTLTKNGDIFQLTQNSFTQVTHQRNLIQPVPVGTNILALQKDLNFSTLWLFDQGGQQLKAVFDGSAATIDQMVWASDAAVSPDQSQIAFVSDHDRNKIGLPDNALFLQDLRTNKVTFLVRPAPYSGGIANPQWNPVDQNQLSYTFYETDSKTGEPFSVIQLRNNKTNETSDLTTQEQNAFQGTFSSDGKQFAFLSRNAGKNSVTLYLADFTNNRLQNIHQLLSGDLAYPRFSFLLHHLYYLAATENSDYTIMSATVDANLRLSAMPIAAASSLSATSFFSVTK